MMLVKCVFCVLLVLMGINVLLIALGEMGLKSFSKNLDVYYFTGSAIGFGLLATVIWGVFTI